MNTLNKIIKYLTNKDYRFVISAYRGRYKDMEDESYLKRLFKGSLGYDLNLDNPKTFNEKVQWLKINDRKNEYIAMVDKLLAKEYVSGIIGPEYIVPTYGVWDCFDNIDFDILPDKFVLKCTHDSGGIAICRNKQEFDYQGANRRLSDSLQNNFYFALREWPYKDVKPQIMAEMFLENNNDIRGLTDYKFFCFNGKAEFLYISKGLENHATARISFYDLNGNELDFCRSDYTRMGKVTLPDNYDEMRDIANKMAREINSPFVRIDLYSVNGKIFFSEITFSPCGGFVPFSPSSADEKVGKLLILPRRGTE